MEQLDGVWALKLVSELTQKRFFQRSPRSVTPGPIFRVFQLLYLVPTRTWQSRGGGRRSLSAPACAPTCVPPIPLAQPLRLGAMSTHGELESPASAGSVFFVLGLTHAWQVRKSNKNHTLATAEFQLCEAGVSDQS